MKVLITGATGAVGPVVVRAIHDAGYDVRTLSLDNPPVGIWPDGVDAVTGDVTDISVVRAATDGVDAVVHMAALLHIVDPPLEMREKYVRINVGGTAAVVEAAIKMCVQRVVLFSTIAVYGHSDGSMLNEMSPTYPDTFYAQTKHAAEQIVLNAKNADGLRLGTVLRFGAIYGSRIKGHYERLIHALLRNRFIPVGNGLNRRTLIYDKDVGRAVARVVSHPAAAGCLYNVTDGGFHSMNEIIESICIAIGRKPPRMSLPAGPVRTVAGLISKGAGFLGKEAPITRETVDKYTEDIAVDGSLIQKEIGFKPKYDLKTGWDETIREMRQMGTLPC